MTAKAEALMLAMSEHEGWSPPANGQPKGGSRSYRNHNPGNLRKSPFASGEQEGFAYFRNDFVGFMAFHWDLLQKAHGNTSTGLGPDSTLRDLIFTWAPPTDGNDSEAYLKKVCARTGLEESTTLKEIFAV